LETIIGKQDINSAAPLSRRFLPESHPAKRWRGGRARPQKNSTWLKFDGGGRGGLGEPDARGSSGNKVFGGFSNHKPFVSDARISQKALSGRASRLHEGKGNGGRTSCSAPSVAALAAFRTIGGGIGDKGCYRNSDIRGSLQPCSLLPPHCLTMCPYGPCGGVHLR
jgi:hypothetical protein